MTDDVDLDGLHALAVEVDATRRLISVADELVAELLERRERIENWVEDLNGGDPGEGSPTRMDRIRELSQAWAITTDLLLLADRICVAVDNYPRFVHRDMAEMMRDHVREIEALNAELEAARAEAGG